MPLTPIVDGNKVPFATAVNDFGDVAVVEQQGPTSSTPLIFQDGKLFSLPAGLSGVSLGQPEAINNSGELIGFFPFGDFRDPHRFATYQRGNTVYKLDDLVDPADPLKSFVTFDSAFGINDSGWIGALGLDSRDKHLHTFLLQRKSPDVQVARVRGGCPASDIDALD